MLQEAINRILCRKCRVTWYNLKVPLKEGAIIKAKHLTTMHKDLPRPKNGYRVNCPDCNHPYAKAIINGIEHVIK